MDRLKHSLEDREAPTCPTCGIEMQWYRSELVRFVPVTNLHLFNCPTCFLLAESETVNEPVWVSPDKLAVAGFRFLRWPHRGSGRCRNDALKIVMRGVDKEDRAAA